MATAVLRSSSSRHRASSARMPFDASVGEGAHGIAENRRGMQGIPRDDRHHHVEFQLAGISGRRDRGVAAHHLVTHLVDHLRNRRIDLARHDRRSGLHGRQLYFRKACARPHAEEPQVGGHLAHFDRQPPKRA